MLPPYKSPRRWEALTLGNFNILVNETITITVSTMDGVIVESISTDLFDDTISVQALQDATFKVTPGA